MSAMPQPWEKTMEYNRRVVEGVIGPGRETERDVLAAYLTDRFLAFDALLAVAKAVDQPAPTPISTGWPMVEPGTRVTRVCVVCWHEGPPREHRPGCAMGVLDAAHPGWREWQP